MSIENLLHITVYYRIGPAIVVQIDTLPNAVEVYSTIYREVIST